MAFLRFQRHAFYFGRFRRTAVTVWDASTLKPVAKLRLEKAPSGLEAGLSNDGKTAVTFTFGKEQAIELWDVAAGRSLAVLRPPSRAVTEAFTDDGTQLNKARLLPSQLRAHRPFLGYCAVARCTRARSGC